MSGVSHKGGIGRWMVAGLAAILCWTNLAAAVETVLQPTGDVWIRERSPGQTFENDLISVWSTQSDEGIVGRRYGVVEYDLTPLIGKPIVKAELRLFSLTAGSQAGYPMKHTVYNLADGPTPVTGMTWSLFMSERDAGKAAFETLGKVNLGPINEDGSQQNVYILTLASAADRALLAAEIAGDGKLTLAFIADEDGTAYRRDWGDSGYQPFQPPLLVVDDSDCDILTTSLPDTFVGNAYAATVESTGTCPDPAWAIVGGALPEGLELHPVTGIISGTPVVTGPAGFTVELSAGGTVKTRQLTINVAGDTVVALPASSDVWIRQVTPGTTYENDLISVWSLQGDPDTPGRRYGVVELNVSSLAGLSLQGASQQFWSTANRAIKQSAFIIDSSGTPVGATTWQSFMAEDDATKQAFAQFGRFDLVGSLTGLYLSSGLATQADLDLIQAEANGDGKLTLVIIADETAAYRRDWADGVAHPSLPEARPPMLAVDVGSSCAIVTPMLPDADQGVYYTAQLEASAGCGANPTWVTPDCFPAGLTLDPATGLISGFPEFSGPADFTVELLPDGGGATRVKDYAMTVFPSIADLDQDGDADEFDAAAFQAAFTGPVAPQSCTLTADDPLPGIAPTADVWIRELPAGSNTTFEGDLLSIWSATTGDRRYAVVEFDVSAFAGQSIAGATLDFWRYPGFSQLTRPMKHKAYIINTVPGEVATMTWAGYMAYHDAGKLPLETLGSMDIPAGLGGMYTGGPAATAADLSAVAAAAAGSGRLTLVLIAEEDGTDYRVDWGDGNNVQPGYVNSPPMLRLYTGQCLISAGGLPLATAGTPYSGQLSLAPGCAGAATWQVTECDLPLGLTLSPSGAVTGTPLAAGTWSFKVQATIGAATTTRNLGIEVQAGSEADFDLDGDVDLLDFHVFSLAYTGVVGSKPICGTLEYLPSDTPKNVPDGGSATSTVSVPAGVTVADLNVAVDVTHPFAGDVKVTLTSPGGQTVILQDYSSTISDPQTPRTFDDEGSPQPVDPLMTFDGTSATGTWTLTVSDFNTEFMDFPVLNSWKLIVTVP